MFNKRILKTLSWSTVGILTAITTSYWVFGEIIGSLTLVGIDTIVFTTLYYAHEYVWEKLK